MKTEELLCSSAVWYWFRARKSAAMHLPGTYVLVVETEDLQQ